MEFSLLDSQTNTILKFPVAPTSVQVQVGPKTLSFSPILMGDVEVPKGRQAARITWSGLLPGPGRSLPGIANAESADAIVSRLVNWAQTGARLRLIITETPWNLVVFISSFEPTNSGGNGDVNYTISLTEWRPLIVQEVGQARTQSTAAGKRADTRPQPKTYTVKAGDSLWKIAQRIYGNGSQWRKIYEANRDKIKNPDLIYPGQQFVIPA